MKILKSVTIDGTKCGFPVDRMIYFIEEKNPKKEKGLCIYVDLEEKKWVKLDETHDAFIKKLGRLKKNDK